MGASRGKRLTTKNGMAAGGAGTILVFAADQLAPGHDLLRHSLTYIAPTVTVGTSAIWAFSADWFIHFREKRRISSLSRAALKRRDQVLNDPHSSDELKSMAKTEFEQVMRITMEVDGAEARAIKARRID